MLAEVPYPHAVGGLIKCDPRYNKLHGLDRFIGSKESSLLGLQTELEAPLPRWMQDNRTMGHPQEADAELARRKQLMREAEEELAGTRQDRARLAADLQVGLQSIDHRIEACSHYHGRLVGGIAFHPVIAALHLAFQDHRTVCFSPDMIWLLIAQGVANHLHANAETLRSQFVKHQGQVLLKLRRDDFCKGSPENPWAEVFPELSKQVTTHVGDDTHDFFVASFSTTGAVERAAFEVVLLDAMQSYFIYELVTECGIPEIILEGTADDWRGVLERTGMLTRFGMEWWLPPLRTILEQFVEAVEGRPDTAFWQSIYKYHSFSGNNCINGWIIGLFPYFKDERTGRPSRQNRWLAEGGRTLEEMLLAAGGYERELLPQGPAIDAFSTGLSRAPSCGTAIGENIKWKCWPGLWALSRMKRPSVFALKSAGRSARSRCYSKIQRTRWLVARVRHRVNFGNLSRLACFRGLRFTLRPDLVQAVAATAALGHG